MFGSFPHEAVPDGTVWVAHHYTYLVAAALFASLTVWDDYRDREPLAVSGALSVGVFAFLFMWPIRGYHALGAVLALAGPAVAIAAVLRPASPWRQPATGGGYPASTAAAVVLLATGALDDAVEHAFGVPTPLDAIFGLVGVWGSVLLAVVTLLLSGLAYQAWGRPNREGGRSPTFSCMTQYPSKSKTVLWFLLTALAVPALVYAGQSFAAGDFYTAVGASVVGALALVAFAITYLVEFPGEENIKDVVDENTPSEEQVQEVSEQIGDVVGEETSSSGRESE